jgi:hypothetical protein
MKKNVYGFTLAFLSSAAMAGPINLDAQQMDAVTAGSNAGATTFATATGAFAFTGTTANALATQSDLNGVPALTGYAAIGGGVATATSLGQGASSNTAAGSTANVSGTNVTTYAINVNQSINGVSISGSTTAQFGSFQTPLVIP